MRTRQEIVDALTQCFASIGELCSGLDEQQWGVQGLCPDWDITGTLLHLTAIEHMLAGWFPESLESPLPFGDAMAYLEAHSDQSGAAGLAEYIAVTGVRAAELAQMTDEQFAQPSPTPVGPATYARFMAVRVFDFWVHEQDMRRPLGLPGHASGLAAEIAIDEIEGSMGYIVGKKIGLDEGQSIRFTLTGPVQREICMLVDGRAGQVPSLDTATTDVTVDSTTFALLACGRIDPQSAIDAGDISWTGDDEIGDRAARNLAFTM